MDVPNLPQQNNIFDCGIYCMTFAEFLSRTKNVYDIRKCISSKVMHLYRSLICYELHAQTLYYKTP